MQKKNLIISTCGTSLLTNNVDNTQRNKLFQYSNVKSLDEIESNDDKKLILLLIAERSAELDDMSISEVKKLSAELNGIFTFYQDQIDKGDMMFFIPTDTYLGKTTASMIQSYLSNKFQIESCLVFQPDLQTRDFTLFHFSLCELSQKLGDIYEGFHKSYKIIYNLTGGFKGVNGFLQSIAQIFADESFYLFETAHELMKIPRLPLKLEIKELLAKNINILRRLQLGIHCNLQECSDIPDIMLLKVDDQVSLSAWGETFWRFYKEELYSETLLDSPCEEIVFSGKFISSINSCKLTAYQFYEINKKIDLLTHFVLSGFKENLSSLDWRPLKGDIMRPSTHEVNAWSDGDAKRIYCHREQNRIIVDQLGKHLI